LGIFQTPRCDLLSQASSIVANPVNQELIDLYILLYIHCTDLNRANSEEMREEWLCKDMACVFVSYKRLLDLTVYIGCGTASQHFCKI